MIALRRSEERGHAQHGWLDSRHTFSFGDYYDPAHMGFRVLRVINEDQVTPAAGFPTHPHRDMEIVTYVLKGALEHRDSMGNGSVIRPGDVQRMSAGTGVTHSEYNHSKSDPVHFLQIWIVPALRGVPPGYEQRSFSHAEKRGRLRLVASPDGAEGSVSLHQDARVYASVLGPGVQVEHHLGAARHAWLHVATGSVRVTVPGTPSDTALDAGDALAVSGEPSLVLTGSSDAEVLLFDLP